MLLFQCCQNKSGQLMESHRLGSSNKSRSSFRTESLLFDHHFRTIVMRVILNVEKMQRRLLLWEKEEKLVSFSNPIFLLYFEFVLKSTFIWFFVWFKSLHHVFLPNLYSNYFIISLTKIFQAKTKSQKSKKNTNPLNTKKSKMSPRF